MELNQSIKLLGVRIKIKSFILIKGEITIRKRNIKLKSEESYK